MTESLNRDGLRLVLDAPDSATAAGGRDWAMLHLTYADGRGRGVAPSMAAISSCALRLSCSARAVLMRSRSSRRRLLTAFQLSVVIW